MLPRSVEDPLAEHIFLGNFHGGIGLSRFCGWGNSNRFRAPDHEQQLLHQLIIRIRFVHNLPLGNRGSL